MTTRANIALLIFGFSTGALWGMARGTWWVLLPSAALALAAQLILGVARREARSQESKP